MIWLGRLVTLGVVVWSLWYFEANPRVLLFAFILITVAQVVQVKLFYSLARSPRFRSFVISRTRNPTKAESEWAENYVKLQNAATNLPQVLMMIGILTLFAFMLSHVDQHKELDFDFATFAGEMTFALGLTALYIIESLVLGETVMDLDRPPSVNLHYESRRITALALAVLMAGAGIAYLQSTGQGTSPWVIIGPLLVMKYAFDIAARRNR